MKHYEGGEGGGVYECWIIAEQWYNLLTGEEALYDIQ